MRYASDTSVSVEKSRAEIETTLSRYGADTFAYMASPERAAIGFRIRGRQIRFIVPLPDRKDKRFWSTPAGRRQRSQEDAYRAWEQACRQRWRALALAIKAKLEAVESGIASFDDEFLAYVVLPSGETFGEWARPQLAEITTGNMPPLLPAPTDG